MNQTLSEDTCHVIEQYVKRMFERVSEHTQISESQRVLVLFPIAALLTGILAQARFNLLLSQ